MFSYLIVIKATHPIDHGGDYKSALIDAIEHLLAEEGFDDLDSSINHQGGDVTEGLLYRMSMGEMHLSSNGVVLKSTKADPAEFRGGAPRGQLAVVKYGGDVIREDDVHDELAFWLIKRSEEFRDDDDDLTGTVECWVRDPRRGGSDDHQFTKAMTLTPTAILVHKPVHMQPLSAAQERRAILEMRRALTGRRPGSPQTARSARQKAHSPPRARSTAPMAPAPSAAAAHRRHR